MLEQQAEQEDRGSFEFEWERWCEEESKNGNPERLNQESLTREKKKKQHAWQGTPS